MSATKKDAGELWTELEESLRTVKGIASVLLRMGEVHGADSPIFAFLGDQLSDK